MIIRKQDLKTNNQEMSEKRSCKSGGFTMIEMLIVISLFGLIFTGSIGIFAMILRNKEKTTKILDERRQVGDALSVINREIINARNLINNPNCGVNDFDATQESIEINNANGSLVFLGLDADGNVVAGNRLLIDKEMVIFDNVGFRCRRNGSRYAFEFSIDIDNNGDTETYKTYAVVRNEI